MKPGKNMQSFLREASDARMAGVGGDFLDQRTNDERAYVPSPRIEPFHLNDGNYISRQTRDYEQKRKRIAKSSP